MPVNTTTLAELNNTAATQVQGTVTTLTAATTLTSANNGTTYFLASAGGFTVTLPAHEAGLRFKFIVKTNPTTAYVILSATADTIVGWPINCGGADSVADGNAAGDQLNFVANTALAGDFAEFISDGTSWHVHAHAKALNAITITG